MLTYGFFNSIKEDSKYCPHQLSGLFLGLMPNGICSGIGNGFACEVKDSHTIKIRSGLGYFNGYYIYNDSEMEYEISEEVYPNPGLGSIYVESQPHQTEYPSGNPIDLDGLTVMGVKSNVSASSIFINEAPQTDYPYGSSLDLGLIEVRAELEAEEGDRVGDCYIVLEFDDINRTFDLKAINTNDYISSIHHVIAICHKSTDGLVCENVVGKTVSNILTTRWITGLFQAVLIDDILDDIEYAEDSFLNTFRNEKNTYWNNWISNNQYYLYHLDGGPTQYSRLTDELSQKEDKPIKVFADVYKGTTTTSVYVANLPEDATISFKCNTYGLMVDDMSIVNGYITITHKEADRNYSICLVIR